MNHTAIKSVLAGLVVSFIGSVPMGYLNLLAYDIYRTSGWVPMSAFVMGIITVEFFVIMATLRAAKWLLSRPKLVIWMEVFTILFLIAIATGALLSAGNTHAPVIADPGETTRTLYLKGVGLSLINVLQYVFWSGWNVYLMNNGYVGPRMRHHLLYTTGGVGGTYLALVVFSLVMNNLVVAGTEWIPGFGNYLVPVLLFALAAFQAWKTIRKRKQVRGSTS